QGKLIEAAGKGANAKVMERLQRRALMQKINMAARQINLAAANLTIHSYFRELELAEPTKRGRVKQITDRMNKSGAEVMEGMRKLGATEAKELEVMLGRIYERLQKLGEESATAKPEEFARIRQKASRLLQGYDILFAKRKKGKK
ncbi:MAG: hypothetical protein JW772_02405, partial [Candidatus Diapherotrites archaeon]|nr:hypothetical protein [Candidatus Diapherotrites archaeon]